MTKLSKCLWHLDIISFLNFGLCSFWDIQGCCWCTVFGDSGGPLVEMILYRRFFLSWIDGNLRKLTVPSGPLASVSFDPSDVVYKKWWGFTWWFLDHCLPRVAQERMRRVHGRTWGDPRLVMLVRLVISLYKRIQNASTKQGKLPSRKMRFVVKNVKTGKSDPVLKKSSPITHHQPGVKNIKASPG